MPQSAWDETVGAYAGPVDAIERHDVHQAEAASVALVNLSPDRLSGMAKDVLLATSPRSVVRRKKPGPSPATAWRRAANTRMALSQ